MSGLLLAALLAPALLPAADRNATLVAILERHRYQAIALDPAGRRAAAFTYRESVQDLVPAVVLHRFDLVAGEHGEVALGRGNHGCLAWSADGDELAFLRWSGRDTELWYLPWSDRQPSALLVGDLGRTVFDVFWRGDELLVLRDLGAGVAVTPVDRRRGDLGEDLCRVHGLYVQSAALSHDGRRLALVAARQQWQRAAGQALDLYVLDLARPVPARFTSGEGIAGNPAFSQDDRHVLCTWIPEPTLLSTRKREVLAFGAAGGAPRVISAELPTSLGDGIYGSNERLWLTPDARVVVASQRGMADHVLALPLAGGAPERWTDGECSYKSLVLSRDGRRGLSVQSGPRTPERLYLHDFTRASGRILHEPNARLDPAALGRPGRLAFTGRDGWPMEALLILPPAGEPPHPLLVSLHGGSSGRHTLRFNAAHAQAYASLGYAVLLPNTRGSSGYSEEFGAANVGDFGGREVEDVLAAVEAALAQGRFDPGRVFLYGHSYGGYLAQMVLARSRRFRAAASDAGVSDWAAFFESSDLAVLATMGLGGTPDEVPEAYRCASPLHQAGAIATPLLLLHGEWDRRVPPAQSQLMYEALQRQGVPCDLHLVAREGHNYGRTSSVARVLARVDAWFRAHSAGAQPPAR